VLITRSEPGASALASALEAAGFSCEVAPIIEIERVEAGIDVLRALADQHVVVFTSVHAVEHAFALVECAQLSLPTRATWIAIGGATAAALARHGIDATTPEIETSEGALAMAALARIDDRRVMIVGGAGGRRVLDAELRARGAHLARATVYRRRRAATDRAVRCVRSDAHAIVVVSSAEGGRAFARALRASARGDASDAARIEERIADLAVIAPSVRVARALAKRGFRRTIVSRGASAAAVIEALRAAAIGSKH